MLLFLQLLLDHSDFFGETMHIMPYCNKARICVVYFEIRPNVLNVFIDIQTSKELIQVDADKIMTYGTFTMDDEKLTQS